MDIEEPASSAQVKSLAVRSIEIMATGSRADFDSIVHPSAFNRESESEPPSTRGRGPEAFYASALWLRSAFAELRFDVEHVVVEDDLAVVHTIMRGRQMGPFVVYDERGAVTQVFAPTGRTFAVKQSHWLRVEEGRVIEHWANRDDLGQAVQLGWVPPTPLSLVRNAWAKRAARRNAPR
ncbi:ester cyclase [Rhodococcus jostii]|uniref:SnoaL-like polyketide cyclase n=1 Tax=Rhodococcus jostii TaxID=132919 RepID=A0A1H5HG51_RHOJO|nr:ester cyclase [Rhodococcus jostii]SEE26611.1 SnoaL-like polyketide cyclase [Rhodococcus jostii]